MSMDTLSSKLSHRLVIALLLIGSSFGSSAEEIKPTIKISVVVENPLIEQIKTIITSSYAQLGFKLAFYQIPPDRALKLTDSGELDAELVRLSTVEKHATNLIRVPVLISKGHVILNCLPTVTCDKSILDDSTKVIGVNGDSTISSTFIRDFNASSYNIPIVKSLGNVLEKSRLEYVISLEVEGFGNILEIDPEKFQSFELMNFEAYHYIHTKHKDLLQPLTDVLQQEMDKRK